MSHMMATHITAAAHVAMAAHITAAAHVAMAALDTTMVCFFLFDSLFILSLLTNVF